MRAEVDKLLLSSSCKILSRLKKSWHIFGLDIGDTFIGMHVKRVQVPLIPVQRELGGAHVTALASRPKLIGGARATYTSDPIRKF